MPWDREEKIIAPIKVGLSEVKVKVDDLEVRAFFHTPVGFCKVVALFVDPSSGKLVVQYDDEPIVE